MGRTQREYERLRLQARNFEPITKKLFDQIGLSSGMNCLDVGSGPGEAMHLMGEYVGKNGRVTGIDLDRDLGTAALSVLKKTAISDFKFIEGDITDMTEIPGQPFDLTFARFLLIHVNEPVDVLMKMHELTKSDGYVAVQEYDFQSWEPFPKIEEWDELKRLWFDVYDGRGKDPRVGFKLATYFVEAGIGEPDGTDTYCDLSSLENANNMNVPALKNMLPHAVELGLITEKKGNCLIEQIQEKAHKQYHSMLFPMLISVWKKIRTNGKNDRISHFKRTHRTQGRGIF